MIGPDDVVLAISQSGETADTLAAIQLAKDAGALVIGICNVAGSSISRETNAGVYTHAGTEIGVASTKAFTAQVTVLTMMAIMIGREKKLLSDERFTHLIKELNDVPAKIEKILEQNDEFKRIAEIYKDSTNALYLGRGVSFPVALEGALKLKEISYIHAEGYPAAEMKHGPIALIDENMPVVFIANHDSSYEKIVSNIQEVKARNGVVIAIVTEGDTAIRGMADHVIEIPQTDEVLVAIPSVVPLQLIAYHIAVIRGCNVDQPRNLAKSVTVE
jgi:glucosamine--fructose-6-phosphate aminotransferase (isomerizing)